VIYSGVQLICNGKSNMKDWLDKQKLVENDMLDSVSIQAKQIAEDLIPQIRLCALENEMCSDVLIKVHFEFNDENTEIWSEGAVEFPPKQSVSECFSIGYGEEEKKPNS
jgi:hypothetical protein